MFEFYVVSVGVCFTLIGMGLLMGYTTGDMSPDLLLIGFMCIIALIPLANLYLLWNLTEGTLHMFGELRNEE